MLLYQWGTRVRERGGVTCSPCALHGDRLAVKQPSALGPSWREKKALEYRLPLWEQDLTVSSLNQMWRSGWILLFLKSGTLLLFVVNVLVSPVSVTRMCHNTHTTHTPHTIHTCTHTHKCTHMRIQIHHTHTHVYTCSHTHTCVHISSQTIHHICMYTPTNTYIHTHKHILIYTHILAYTILTHIHPDPSTNSQSHTFAHTLHYHLESIKSLSTVTSQEWLTAAWGLHCRGVFWLSVPTPHTRGSLFTSRWILILVPIAVRNVHVNLDN